MAGEFTPVPSKVELTTVMRSRLMMKAPLLAHFIDENVVPWIRILVAAEPIETEKRLFRICNVGTELSARLRVLGAEKLEKVRSVTELNTVRPLLASMLEKVRFAKLRKVYVMEDSFPVPVAVTVRLLNETGFVTVL